ncbi:DUF885 domain-containing protein [Murimonas intestini]|nr:DUF885 domain-containing protein [Murimonas intestini]MCR1841989.1 DUF885 domain-containing protein [Murimonas intestini]
MLRIGVIFYAYPDYKGITGDMMRKPKLSTVLRLLLIPAAAFLIFSVCFYIHKRSEAGENEKFTDFTTNMFCQELLGNTLNLHYTVSDPTMYGIQDYQVTLGSAEPAALEASFAVLENYQNALHDFSYSSLSEDNQITYDILDAYLSTQETSKDFLLYDEPLGPTIGTQAQLPVLLAEYSFHSIKDIEDYLGLLEQMDVYYGSLLHYEQAKSAAGLFMSSRVADNIIAQCQAFIQNPSDNFLITTFNARVDALSGLSEEQKAEYKKRNGDMVLNHVIPAYKNLIEGLTALNGTGKNDKGLCWLPDGKAYYEYLVHQSTGCYASVDTIQQRIQSQLTADYQALMDLVAQNPSILSTASAYTQGPSDPDGMLKDLKQKIAQDFPDPPEVNFEVKYVDSSLEDYLSPAFYLTPPIDDITSNVIYINRGSGYTPLELYTTLAHEGYPGHLYQTVYSAEKTSNPMRSLLSFGGYTEGWATYVEMYSYGLADVKKDNAELFRLNRSIMLGVSSLLDIAIHYHGYSREDTAAYLEKLGLKNSDSFYDMILEAPANYLKYYVGYLCFSDLRDSVKKVQGENFSLKDFHEEVLTIGPAPFSVLEKYMKKAYSNAG